MIKMNSQTEIETQGKTKNQYINKDNTEEHNTELLRRKAGMTTGSRKQATGLLTPLGE
jgi:hypothetical protein